MYTACSLFPPATWGPVASLLRLLTLSIPDCLTYLLRNLYSGQEATVRTRLGTTDWFQIGKGVRQGYVLPLCLFNLYGDYIMGNARLDESQAGIKIAGRNISNLRYADDTTLGASLVAQRLKLLPGMRETGFHLWVGKIPWRRKWHPTPVFLPGESHGQRSLASCSPWGCRVRRNLETKQPPNLGLAGR